MQSIREKARAKSPVSEMPAHERPISEEFRLVAKAWVEADAAARLLEETKSSLLSKLVMASTEPSIGRAEHAARASQDYTDHIDQMCKAKAEANLRRVQMKFVEMRFSEWQSSDANARRERQMGRQAT
jgi:hypothetical protein